MKKSIVHLCKMLLIICISTLFLWSCKSQKQPVEQIEIKKEKEIIKTESETINKAIADQTIIPVVVAKSKDVVNDSLVNAKVDEILSKLNYQKQSGDNSLMVKYNALLKQLEIISKIGETNNKNASSLNTEYVEVPVIKNVPYPVIQPLSKMQKLLIALGVGFSGFYILKYGFRLFATVKQKIPWV